jgi:hypothetical protein
MNLPDFVTDHAMPTERGADIARWSFIELARA